MAIIIKSQKDIQAMRDAGKINVEALTATAEAIRPGVTTAAINQIAHDILAKYDAVPAFLGYPPGSRYPFPATTTICINEELVHGIPSKSRMLKEGDIVSVDCGTIYKGYVADSAYSIGVGDISDEARQLLTVTEDSLYVGIEAAVRGNRFGDVSASIQAFVEGYGYNVPREYGGHGVGRSMHEDPHIPNWGKRGRGKKLRPGMTFALEPMVMMGDAATKVLKDHWTVITADRKLSAHYEHTVLITDNGPEILTPWEIRPWRAD